MAEIHILSSETINRIAAGEVVERPVNVVKELVENSIDAGADAVTVEIRQGGIDLIRVTDNGCGIEPSQLTKAFRRHATSKISDERDLSHLHSLGFRGEALSSIAAVSEVEMITKTKDRMIGMRAKNRSFTPSALPHRLHPMSSRSISQRSALLTARRSLYGIFFTMCLYAGNFCGLRRRKPAISQI